MLDFDAWMKAHKLSDQAVADRVSLTAGYISRIRRGVVHPNLGTALALHEMTSGQVPIRMFLPNSMRPITRRILPGRVPGTPQTQPVRRASK